ncbi:MAG: hypothetical protein ACOC5R_01490 [Elusimicrobiota bacterium]
MKYIFICLILIFISSPVMGKDITGDWAIGIHYPGVGLKYGGKNLYSTEYRFAHKSGITLLGYRKQRLMKSYQDLNIYLGGEADFIFFVKEKYDMIGTGAGLEIFGAMEYFFIDNMSMGMDMGPGSVIAFDVKGGGMEIDWGVIINFTFNWYFRKDEKN